MTTANTPAGTGIDTLGSVSSIEQGLALYNARNPNAKASDQVQPVLPEDEIEGYEQEETEEAVQPEQTEGEPEQEATQEAPEEEAPDTRPVIMPDGSEVSVEELRKGHLRWADYTRKTQEVAEERRALVAEKTGWAQQAQALLQNLDALQEKEPDWTQLAQSRTPEEYNQIHAWWHSRQRTVDAAKAELQRTQRQAFEVQKRRFYDYFQEGRYNPEWREPAKMKQGLTQVYEYANGLGYTPDVIDSLTDPNLLVVFDKARRLDELEGKKPVVKKALSGKPPVAKAGSKTAASPQVQSVKMYEEKFGKTRSIDDAVALFNAKQSAQRPSMRR